MLNSITIEGILGKVKESKATVNEREIKTATSKVTYKRYGNEETIAVKAQYGRAEDLLKKSEGDTVRVSGRLCQKAIEKDGQTRYVSYIDVETVQEEVNTAVLEGRFVADPEISHFEGKNGDTVSMKGRIAVSRERKNEEGKYDSDFVNLQVYGKTGEIIAQYFHKGDPIIVCGVLSNREYTDKNSGAKGVFTEIQVNTFSFPVTRSSKASSNGTAANAAPVSGTGAAAAEPDFYDTATSAASLDAYDDLEF